MNKKLKNLPFTSVHNHTDDSNLRGLDSTIKVEQLINTAISLSYNAVAITDHECLSNHVQGILHLKKLQKNNQAKDFKLLLGNEIYLVNSIEGVKNKTDKYFHFILVAKDEIGHEQLRQLSSIAWNGMYKAQNVERVPTLKSTLKSIVSANKGHLIASTACLGGELPFLINEYLNDLRDENKKQKIENFILEMQELFEEDLYFELQPVLNDNTQQSYQQKIINKMLVKLGEVYNIKCIVTTDSHYLKKEHKLLHYNFLNSKENESRETGDFYNSTYMMGKEELFGYISNHIEEEKVFEMFNNTMEIYNKCKQIDLHKDTIVPEDKKGGNFVIQHIFKDYYKKYPYIEKFNNDEKDRRLLYLIEKGFIEKKQEFNEVNLSRINTELMHIYKTSEKINEKLSKYYTLTNKLIEIIWKKSFVGVARGSVTGFYICYLADIIQINPIEHGLHEWRHLHFERPELPKHYWALSVNLAKGCVSDLSY